MFRVSGVEKVVSISRIRDVDGGSETDESELGDSGEADDIAHNGRVSSEETIEDAIVED